MTSNKNTVTFKRYCPGVQIGYVDGEELVTLHFSDLGFWYCDKEWKIAVILPDMADTLSSLKKAVRQAAQDHAGKDIFHTPE